VYPWYIVQLDSPSCLVLSNCGPTFQLLAGLSGHSRVEEQSLRDDMEHAGEAHLNFSFIWAKAAIGYLKHKCGKGRQHERFRVRVVPKHG